MLQKWHEPQYVNRTSELTYPESHHVYWHKAADNSTSLKEKICGLPGSLKMTKVTFLEKFSVILRLGFGPVKSNKTTLPRLGKGWIH